MSLAQVPTLTNLGIRNVGVNIVRHGQQLKEMSKNEEILYRYEQFKFLFSDDLFQELQQIHSNAETMEAEQLLQFLQFLFCTGESENDSLDICLKLLFNKHTTILSSRFCGSTKMPVKLLQKALLECKNLKVMTLMFYDFVRTNYISSLPTTNTLVKVDLLYSYAGDEVVTKLLRRCPNLQILKARGKLISSDSLYSVCTAQEVGKKCNGNCSKIGKKIHTLIIYGTSFSTKSVACALLHLTSLKIFRDTLWLYNDKSMIPAAVLRLRTESLKRQRPVVLNLTSICFSFDESIQNINSVLEFCPRVKSCCIKVSARKIEFLTLPSFESLTAISLLGIRRSRVTSHEFHQFLVATGHQLESICIIGEKESLELIHISDILDHCRNLKKIFLHCITVTCEVGEGHLLEAEIRSNNLEKICLAGVFPGLPDTGRFPRFFRNLLSVSLKLKFIGFSHTSATAVLIPAMNRNSFSDLEEISLYFVDLYNASLKPLIHYNSRLREIIVFRCRNKEIFVKELYQAARDHDLTLEINIINSDYAREQEFPRYCLTDE